MSKVIVFSRSDGGVSIVIPAPGQAESLGMDEDAYLGYLIGKDVPADAIAPHIIDQADVPTDRTLRDAWRHEPGKGISVDLDAAKPIVAARIEGAKRAKLAETQLAFSEAIETGDTATADALRAQRQAVRDAAAAALGKVDKAKSPEALLALAP